MLLDWLGRAHGVFPAVEAAAAMREAMDRALASPATRTRDIAGTADLEGMTQGILSALGAETGKTPHASAVDIRRTSRRYRPGGHPRRPRGVGCLCGARWRLLLLAENISH